MTLQKTIISILLFAIGLLSGAGIYSFFKFNPITDSRRILENNIRIEYITTNSIPEIKTSIAEINLKLDSLSVENNKKGE